MWSRKHVASVNFFVIITQTPFMKAKSLSPFFQHLYTLGVLNIEKRYIDIFLCENKNNYIYKLICYTYQKGKMHIEFFSIPIFIIKQRPVYERKKNSHLTSCLLFNLACSLLLLTILYFTI